MIAKESRIYTGVYPIDYTGLTRAGVNVSLFSRFRQDIYYKFSVCAKASIDSPFVLNAGIDYGYVIGSIGWGVFNDDSAFVDFKKGDILTFANATIAVPADYTVLSVSEDGKLISLSGTPFGASALNSINDHVTLSLKLDALNIDYIQTINSRLENQNFNSFANDTPETKRKLNVAGTTLLDDITGADANKITKGYNISYLSNALNTENIWEAEILITPSATAESYANVFWREGELENIETLSPPDRMFNDDQVFITRLSIQQVGKPLRRDLDFTSDQYNTHIPYFNKKLDGNETGLSIANLLIEDEATSEVSTGVEIGGSSLVSFTLNSSDIELTDLATKLNFCLLPIKDEYKINARTQKQNFCIDELVLDPDPPATPANGENYASGYGALRDVVFTKINDFQYDITFAVDLAGSTFTNQLAAAYTNKKALLCLNSFGEDETCLLIGVIDILISGNPPSEILEFSDYKYHSHTDTDATPDATPVDATTEEEFVIQKTINIDTATFTNATDTKILKVRQKLIARNSVTDESFDLDIVEFNVAGSGIFNGSASQLQIINQASSRNYTFNERWLKDNTLVSDIESFKLDEAVGIINLKIAGQIRWEYYLNKIGVSTAFYDTSVSKDGLNENFYRYNSAIANWNIYEQTEVECTFINPITGELNAAVYTDDNLITIRDYGQNATYTTKTIQTFNGATEITPNIINYDKTRVLATFENVDTIESVVVVIRAYIFENGTVQSVQHYSSWFETPVGSNVFSSTDGSNMVKVSSISLTKIEAECFIDGSLLTGVQKMVLVAWVKSPASTDFTKQFEDGEDFDFEDSFIYEFEF